MLAVQLILLLLLLQSVVTTTVQAWGPSAAHRLFDVYVIIIIIPVAVVHIVRGSSASPAAVI